ncbi:hypothetical protein QJS10_CPB19g01156 [Acorus calamus]|uniref:Uncharacterized protein n=1 Tax=Acorus calamus TaxID=4465 RepID=A0AAV9CJQ4_ACOCL|nr:hypothetical protein QJS10_CPB19g01156 [Acorus calamus]
MKFSIIFSPSSMTCRQMKKTIVEWESLHYSSMKGVLKPESIQPNKWAYYQGRPVMALPRYLQEVLVFLNYGCLISHDCSCLPFFNHLPCLIFQIFISF